jgi:hypothetical protein
MSLFSKSLQISSCWRPVDFSLEIKNVQFLSIAELIFQQQSKQQNLKATQDRQQATQAIRLVIPIPGGK